MIPCRLGPYQADTRNLLNAYKKLGSPPLRTICECAVGPFSLLVPYAAVAGRTILIEPDPAMAAQARGIYPWAEVFETAIAAAGGTAVLRRLYGSSFISGIPFAPAKSANFARAARSAKIEVKTMPFSEIDDGKIDLLNLDCEGSEWFVLSSMISRPLMIYVELCRKNHYRTQILQWFRDNGYRRMTGVKERGVNRFYVRGV